MAKVHNNILLRGLIGSLGRQIVLRRGKGGQTIVSKRPQFDPDRELSAAQKAHHLAFQQAAAYAKSAREENVYVARAKGTALNPYNVALKDWFHKPEIAALDVDGWDGRAGQAIRIKAVDDTQVVRVRVVITDGGGTVLEQGNAAPGEAFWWTYVTSVPSSGSRRLLVTAWDRPGNIAQCTWQDPGRR